MIFVICGKKRTGKDTVAKILNDTGEFSSYAFADNIKRILESAGFLCGVEAFSKFHENRVFWEGDREKPLLASNQEVKQLFEQAISIMIKKSIIESAPYVENYEKDLLDSLIMENEQVWTIRRLMQVFGTDIICNMYDDSIWVRLALNDACKKPPEKIFDLHKGLIPNPNPKMSKHILFTDCRQLHEYKYMQRLGAKFIFLERETGEEDNHCTEKGLTPSEDDYIIDNNGTLDDLKSNILNLIKSV